MSIAPNCLKCHNCPNLEKLARRMNEFPLHAMLLSQARIDGVCWR